MALKKEKNFITFEGMDGSGKSTVIQAIKKRLEEKGYEVVLTREPGGTELGENLRDLIKNKDMSILTEISLFNAIRLEHLNQVILPALKEGKIVLCDRYLDSTLVYQILAVEKERIEKEPLLMLDGNVEKARNELLFKILSYCQQFGIPNPEKTFFLNVDVETSILRRDNRGLEIDKFENKTYQALTDVRNGYISIMEDSNVLDGLNRFVNINANLSIEKVVEQAIDKIEELYPENNIKNTQRKKCKI